jgi:hypothetical protein
MDADIQNLALAPFQDAVAKGRCALRNFQQQYAAACSGFRHEPPPPPELVRMGKSAQGLISHGERALRKIEPLCRSKMEEYGVRFVDALKDNGIFFFFSLATSITCVCWEYTRD